MSRPRSPRQRKNSRGSRRSPRLSGAVPAASPTRVSDPDGALVRKSPRQQRSKVMVDAILQASAELFAEVGYARTTTNKIAQRAGVSVGSLYQYFPNKDCLLAGLLQEHHRQVHGVVARRLPDLADLTIPLDQCIRNLLAELLEVHRANPALTKALSAANMRESPTAAAIDHEADHGRERGVVCALLASRPDVRRGDYEVMAEVLAETMSQLTRWLVHEAPQGMDRTVLVEETVQLLVRYVAAD